jgi:hypothetical protein
MLVLLPGILGNGGRHNYCSYTSLEKKLSACGGFSSTANIIKRGGSLRTQHFVFGSAFATVDRDALRKPRHIIFAKRCTQGFLRPHSNNFFVENMQNMLIKTCY